jgi:hypothetical protein
MYRIFGSLPGVVLLLAVFLPACGSATDADDPDALPDTLAMEPVLRLGEETGDVLFGNPVDALFDGQGRLVVADWKLNTLLVFDDEGALVQRIGGPGEGPGEFRMMSGVVRGPGDSLYVMDMQLRRVSVFSPEGVFGRSFPAATEGGMYPSSLLGAVPEGLPVLYGKVFSFETLREAHHMFVFLLGYDGARRPDTLLVTPGPEMVISEQERGFSVMGKPLGRRPVIDMDERGVLWYGWNDRLEIETIDWRRGARRTAVAFDLPPLPVTPADRDSVMSNPDTRRMLDAAGYTFPDTKPVFSTFEPGPDGTLWVRLTPPYGETEASWLVFDAEGRPRAQVRLPSSVHLHAFTGDRAVGIDGARAEVVVYRLPEMLRAGV